MLFFCDCILIAAAFPFRALPLNGYCAYAACDRLICAGLPFIFASFTCSIIYADLATCLLPDVACCCSLLLMISLWCLVSPPPPWLPAPCRTYAAVAGNSCVHVCVSNCKTGFGAARFVPAPGHIQDTWQLLLYANVSNATHNLNVMPQLRPNRRFQCPSVPNPDSRIPFPTQLGLTLLKTKFVCSSPQSGSLKVQAASGYMFKLQGAKRQGRGREGGGEAARVRLGWPCAMSWRGSMRKSQSRVLSEACREHRKYDNIVNMPSFGQPGCPLTRQFLYSPPAELTHC